MFGHRFFEVLEVSKTAMLEPTGRMRARNRGFTLIELLITFAIAAVLLMVAVPSFVQAARNAELSDNVSNFVSAINVARANALKSGLNTCIAPADGSSWSSGWKVFTDNVTPGTCVLETGDEVIAEYKAVPATITVSTPAFTTGDTNTLAANYLRFIGSGYPRTSAGATANGQITMANQYRSSTVIFSRTGRVRSCTTGSTGCNLNG